ncbi:MAG: hypothetical protein V3U76_18270 [Granulosicoccus sp.]
MDAPVSGSQDGLFEVTGADHVELILSSGDADLNIINTHTITPYSVYLCSERRITSHTCLLPEVGKYYVFVDVKGPASYVLTATNSGSSAGTAGGNNAPTGSNGPVAIADTSAGSGGGGGGVLGLWGLAGMAIVWTRRRQRSWICRIGWL